MINYPDVEGFLLRDALKMMEAAGLGSPEIVITSQPRINHEKYEGDFRVLRQTMTDEGVFKLVVACEES